MTDQDIPDIQIDCVGMAICPRCAVTVDLSAVEAFESAHCHACNTRFVAPGKIGQYILLKQLRRDEIGATYRGFDTAMSRHVQVNVMRRSLGQDAEQVEAFLAEARALALLDSRNTPRAFFVGDEGGRPYSVTELIVGDSLETVLTSGKPLNETAVLETAIALADVLGTLARLHLVHGDIRPENVIFASQPKGLVKLIHFRFANYTPGRTTQGTPPVQLCYASPEHMEGKAIDTRSDMFSLGAVLFRALTGHKPFPDTGPRATPQARRHADAPNALTHRPMLRQETADVLRAMLQSDPAKRPLNSTILLRSLRAALEASKRPKLPAGAESIPPASDQARPAPRPRAPAGTDAASALAAMGATRRPGPQIKPDTSYPLNRRAMRRTRPAPAPARTFVRPTRPASEPNQAPPPGHDHTKAAPRTTGDAVETTVSPPRSIEDRIVQAMAVCAAAIGVIVAIVAIISDPSGVIGGGGQSPGGSGDLLPTPPGHVIPARFGGMVGLGTYKTAAEFKDVTVARGSQVLVAAVAAPGAREQWRSVNNSVWKRRPDNVTYVQNDPALIDAFVIVGDVSWSDYTLALKARKTAGAEGFHIPFRWVDKDNFFVWDIGGRGNTRHYVERRRNGGKMFPITGMRNGKVETGKWYDIRIELKGPNIRCYLDGKLIHDISQK